MASLIRRAFVVAPNFCRILSRTTVPNYGIQQKYRHLKLDNILHRSLSTSIPRLAKETVTIFFIDRDGDRIEACAEVGADLLDVAQDNDVDLEGACEGTLACSTCHLIFTPENYEKIDEKPTDEELDMLDLAYGLTDTSRLGCQVIVTKEMDGWVIQVPEGVADAREP